MLISGPILLCIFYNKRVNLCVKGPPSETKGVMIPGVFLGELETHDPALVARPVAAHAEGRDTVPTRGCSPHMPAEDRVRPSGAEEVLGNSRASGRQG